VRTTNYSLPRHIHRHVDVIQPTTIFSRFKPQKSMVIPPEPGAEIAEQDANTKKILSATGVLVDATCNRTVTILCLQQLYGALGYVPSDNVNNSIAVTGYLVHSSFHRLGTNCSYSCRTIILVQKIFNYFTLINDVMQSTLHLNQSR